VARDLDEAVSVDGGRIPRSRFTPSGMLT
jgi:hypothetical protein